MISPIEIARGVVILFEPDELVAHGVAPDRPRDKAVVGPHYFLCIGRTGPWSIWVPCFSRWVPGRILVGRKWGHPAWAGPESYVDLEQPWTVPDVALGPASRADRSQRGNRNWASCDFLLGPAELPLSA